MDQGLRINRSRPRTQEPESPDERVELADFAGDFAVPLDEDDDEDGDDDADDDADDDDESDVLREDEPEESLPDELSLLLDDESEDDSEELPDFVDESEDASPAFFLAPFASARESLR